ncbi:hypothetical protein QR680_014256 [Steinernema hermaphroditum]|uniref:G-protein coupled receptors family 1 profile domain-containing protein n=1 Tax=Steinernema hermaphroditum TaxID=289476 RepID=A0AA39I899_9BILA|nr:hypothetical protein QR680_014256 [Steinernema hermaphroditum]
MFALYMTSFSIFFIGSFGIFGNVNLVVAILRTLPDIRRSRCGLIIGVVALCDVLCLLFEFQNATRLLLGVQNYRLSCFWAMSLYIYFLNFHCVLLLVLAFDRIFAISTPVTYRTLPFNVYIVLTMIPGFLFASAIFWMSLANMNDEPIDACNPPMAYPPLVLEIWTRWVLALDVLIIVVYILALIVLYWRRGDLTRTESEYFNQQRKAMRTLTVVVILFTSTWLVCHCSVLLATMIGFSESAVHLIQTLAVIPALICYSQNYYIYLWRSTEYRKLFLEQFNTLIHLDLRYCKTSKVHVVSLSQ